MDQATKTDSGAAGECPNRGLGEDMAEQTLQSLLQTYRDAARTERDKGTYFERFAIAYLTHDPIQLEQYEQVQTFKDWADANGWDARDTGIDLVAKLRSSANSMMLPTASGKRTSTASYRHRARPRSNGASSSTAPKRLGARTPKP